MLQLDYAQYQKPLIFSPHPDDLEGFMGGLVYKLPKTVVSVIFCGGNQGVWQTEFEQMSAEDYVRVRLEESEESAKLLGVNEIIYMGYLDRGLVCDEKTIEQALAQLRLHQPDLVLAFEFHHRATPYPHPDHMAAANIVRNAIARYEQRDQLDYYVCSSLLPNRFVDVSATRRVKLEALACHTTQSGLNSVIFPFFEKMMTRLWGVYAGVDYAEGYRKVNIPEMIKRLESA